MSQAASQAAAFYREVAATRTVWGIRDDGGVPADDGRGRPRDAVLVVRGSRARGDGDGDVPRLLRLRARWVEFDERWLAGLERDGIRVGVNWTGPRLTGYDLSPADVRRNVRAAEALARDGS